MGAVEFWSRLIGEVLSWPVVVLVVVVIFRKPLSDLITRIRSYEGLGQKFTFGEQLAQAEEVAEAATEDVGPPELHEQAHQIPPLNAGEEPAYTVLNWWEQLSQAVTALCRAVEPEAVHRGHVLSQVEVLAQRGVVNERFVQAVRDLRRLRNQVAHGQHNPTPGEAVTYAETAREMVRAAELLARLAARAD